MVKAIHAWKPISKRPTRRPKIRWEDDVKKDIQRSKVPNWKTLSRIEDGRKWLRRPKLRNKSCRAALRRRRLFHAKPHLPSITWHHFNLKSIEILSVHADTTTSDMDTVLNRHITSIFSQPPENASHTFLWNTAPQTTCYCNLDHNIFLRHCENQSNFEI